MSQNPVNAHPSEEEIMNRMLAVLDAEREKIRVPTAAENDLKELAELMAAMKDGTISKPNKSRLANLMFLYSDTPYSVTKNFQSAYKTGEEAVRRRKQDETITKGLERVVETLTDVTGAQIQNDTVVTLPSGKIMKEAMHETLLKFAGVRGNDEAYSHYAAVRDEKKAKRPKPVYEVGER